MSIGRLIHLSKTMDKQVKSLLDTHRIHLKHGACNPEPKMRLEQAAAIVDGYRFVLEDIILEMQQEPQQMNLPFDDPETV